MYYTTGSLSEHILVGWKSSQSKQFIVELLLSYHNDGSLNGTVYFTQTTPSLHSSNQPANCNTLFRTHPCMPIEDTLFTPSGHSIHPLQDKRLSGHTTYSLQDKLFIRTHYLPPSGHTIYQDTLLIRTHY